MHLRLFFGPPGQTQKPLKKRRKKVYPKVHLIQISAKVKKKKKRKRGIWGNLPKQKETKGESIFKKEGVVALGIALVSSVFFSSTFICCTNSNIMMSAVQSKHNSRHFAGQVVEKHTAGKIWRRITPYRQCWHSCTKSSVLGPIQFLVYTNDLPDYNKNGTCISINHHVTPEHAKAISITSRSRNRIGWWIFSWHNAKFLI